MGEWFTCLCPNAFSLLAQRSIVAQMTVSFFWISNPCARLDGWKTLKLHQLQQIMLVLFEIYLRKLIIRTESWFWSFDEGMNGITDTHIFCIADYTFNSLSVQYLQSCTPRLWKWYMYVDDILELVKKVYFTQQLNQADTTDIIYCLLLTNGCIRYVRKYHSRLGSSG